MQTRLNETHRKVLHALANQVIDCPKEAEAEDRAYRAAEPLVTAMVEKTFPPGDMEILRKYEKAERDQCIKTTLIDGDVKIFNYRLLDVAPLVANKTYQHQMYLADAKTSKAIDAWGDAYKALEKAKNELVALYKAFIDNAKTYEDVLNIWPEAAQVAGKIKLNLPVALSEADIKRITKDSARRIRKRNKQEASNA